MDHVQFSHPNGQLEEVQKESTEGVLVPALWVSGTAPVTLSARWRTHYQKGHQGWGVENRDSFMY